MPSRHELSAKRWCLLAERRDQTGVTDLSWILTWTAFYWNEKAFASNALYECGCDNYNPTLGPGQNRSFQTSLCVSFGPWALKRPRAKRYAQLVWNDRYCPGPRAGLYIYLPQHQQTSFLDPDVSDRITLTLKGQGNTVRNVRIKKTCLLVLREIYQRSIYRLAISNVPKTTDEAFKHVRGFILTEAIQQWILLALTIWWWKRCWISSGGSQVPSFARGCQTRGNAWSTSHHGVKQITLAKCLMKKKKGKKLMWISSEVDSWSFLSALFQSLLCLLSLKCKSDSLET